MANSYPGKRPLADKYINCQIPDISTASSTVSVMVPSQGVFIAWRGARSATTTGTAAITVSLNGSAQSTAAGSFAAGANTAGVSVDDFSIAVKDGDILTFASDGGSTTASVGTITAVIREL